MPNEQNPGAIRPTLFLGLGGTGKEVLLRLRRKFYERIGEFGLPCVTYLWLDTDTLAGNTAAGADDEILSAVAFESSEKIALLKGNVGADLSATFRNKGAWSHIHEWLHPEVEQYGAEIKDGAGNVRAVGRMTYSYHFRDTIDPRLRAALRSVMTADKITDTQEFFRERNMGVPDFTLEPQVFVVASLAGGTGCGTFLDAMFHLRHLAATGDQPIERVMGMLFMPNVFYPDASTEVSQRSYANAYAALQELEFYTLRQPDTAIDLGKDFKVQWAPGVPKEPVPGPPFSVAYLLEMRNEGGIGLSIDNRAELFNTVAEGLFLDFMPGTFSTEKRSNYSNVTQHLSGQQGTNTTLGPVSLPQTFARRYAAFGMSKIEIPMDQMKSACAAFLAYEISSYVGRKMPDTRVQENARDDMARFKFDADGILSRFGREWAGKISSQIAEAAKLSGGRPTVANFDQLDAKLRDVERQLVNTEGNDQRRWGTAIDAIRRKTKEASSKTNEALTTWLSDSLENDARGLDALISEDPPGYMYYVSAYMQDLYKPDAQKARAQYDTRIGQAQTDAAAWKSKRTRAADEVRQAIRSVGLRLLARDEWAIETLMRRLADAAEQYCLAKAEECLLVEAKAVAQAAVEFLEEKRPSLINLGSVAASSAARFFRRYESFMNIKDAVLQIRFFDRDRDWPAFYCLDAEKDGTPLNVDVAAEYRKLLALGAVKKRKNQPDRKPALSLWNLARLVDENGPEQFDDRLRAFADERFWIDFETHPRMIDVLQHPRMTANRDSNIQRLVRSAMPLVRRDAALGNRAGLVRKVAYLGVPEAGGRYQSFIESVRKELMAQMSIGPGEISAHATGKPWEVYLYVVVYAFPLPSLPVVSNECHDAYHDFYRALGENRIKERQYHIPLHLSSAWEGKFDDLKVLTDSSAKILKESHEVLLFGTVLNVIQASGTAERPKFGYLDSPPLRRLETLGFHREARDRLGSNPKLRESLLSAVIAREKALTKEQLTAYFWILMYLSESPSFSPLSPDGSLTESRIKETYDRLLRLGVPEQDLDTKDPGGGPLQEYARTKAGSSGVNWNGPIPSLTLEQWTLPRASAVA